MCTENLVRIDLMKESLNVGHDGRPSMLQDPGESDSSISVRMTSGPTLFVDEIVTWLFHSALARHMKANAVTLTPDFARATLRTGCLEGTDASS
jgi:hypothetical protein